MPEADEGEDMTPPKVEISSVVGSHRRFPGLGSGKSVRRIQASEEEMQAAKAIVEDPDSGVRFSFPPTPSVD
jgi:hypothetical protein